MSKKFGKLLLFSAVAGAAAYGAYHYMQTKDNAPSPEKGEDTDDDFDDFSEDLDDEPTPAKPRSYVSLNLDKAEAIATEAFHKAKEVITDSVNQVRETVKSVTEGQCSSETNFTDLTALQKEAEENADIEETPAEETAASKEEGSVEEPADKPEEMPAEETSDNEKKTPTGQVEEFFDDTP